MVEEILDGRVPVTDKIIELLLKDKQFKLLVRLISIPKSIKERCFRPKYFNLDQRKYIYNVRKAFEKQVPVV
jgi:hypothetical protein